MPTVGQYVLVRAKDAGCRCGEYQWHNGREICLKNFRQIWDWEGDRLTLVDVGVAAIGETRLSRVNPGEGIMLEACTVDAMSPEVEQMFRTLPHS